MNARSIVGLQMYLLFLGLAASIGCGNENALPPEDRNYVARHVIQPSTDGFFTVSFTSDGKRFATIGWDKTVRIYDTSSGKIIAAWDSTQENVGRTLFSPDDKKLATLGISPDVRIWDSDTNALLGTLALGIDNVKGYQWSPDSTRLLFYGDFKVEVWDAGTLELVADLKEPTDFVTDASFSPDGSQIASVGYDRLVRVWHADSYEPLAVLPGHADRLMTLSYSPDSKYLATGGLNTTFDKESVLIWDTSTFNVERRLRHRFDVVRVAFSRTGETLRTMDRYSIHIWNARSGKYLMQLERRNYPFDMATRSPDGSHLVTIDYTDPDNQKLTIWERVVPVQE